MIPNLAGNLAGGGLLSLFAPKEGTGLLIYILGSLLIGFLFVMLLTQVPNRMRKVIIIGVTFISGWFYFLEYMIPGSVDTLPIRKELPPAQQAVWKASFEVNRAIAISKEKKSDAASVSLRVNRAHADVASAIPHLKKALSAMDSMIQEKQNAVSLAEKARKRAGPESASAVKHLSSDKKADVLEADSRLASAEESLGKLKKAQAGLTNSLSAAEQAEKLLGNSAHTDFAAASAALDGVDGGITSAQTSTSDNFLSKYKEPLNNVIVVVGAFAVGLGVFGLASMHMRSIIRKRPGWSNSLAFWISMVVMLAFGFLQASPNLGRTLSGISTDTYNMLFYGALSALSATMFSLVAFYIVSAAYRAFRIRSGESALMLLAAFLVMLSLVPIGMWMTHWLPTTGFLSVFRLERIGAWIMAFPNTAAQRGMAFGIGVGMLAMAIRVWLSLERGSYFDKQV